MRAWSFVWAVVLVWATLPAVPWNEVSGISGMEKLQYKERVLEMFYHAYRAYMDNAYPADELMPLTCKGRVRGQDRSRGDIDDALGKFSLTLIDTLDTLAVIGAVDEFNSAIRMVIRDVTFDNDIVVSVFETNIRVLGGLLGAHFAAVALKKSHAQLGWYDGELLRMAEEVGRRLLPAFNTTTGLPYPKVNLRHGMSYSGHDMTTCTACAGTNLLEFAALSRLTGNPEYELRAKKAMEVIWERRHQGHDLVGTTINIHNGEWTRRDSGVGAGIDSYYEYCLKSYILLGDQEYLHRFEKHYLAVMRYISNGPMLVDVSMSSPTRMTRNFMDSLLAFWPGLQVLWGDLDSAIHTHDMLYHVTERHNFLPEAFTLDFRLHWGSHPLRPEFVESTYFLYRATGDPYYLDIGRTVVNNLNEFARVSCGFAAIKDLKTKAHEDRMDSFVLAETFKYLYLLFAEEEDLVLDLDDFVFTTEAHLLPLSLATVNTSNHTDAFLHIFVNNSRDTKTSDKDSSPSTPPQSSDPTPASNHEATDTSEPPKQPPTDPPMSESRVVFAPGFPKCLRDSRPYARMDQYQKLMLKQCTSSRFKIYKPEKKRKRLTPPRLTIQSLDFSNQEHLIILRELGIAVESQEGGRVQISHMMQRAKTPEDAEEGYYLMQDIMKLMQQQQNSDGSLKRGAKAVKVLAPDVEEDEFTVGPALFGPDLGENEFQVAAELVEPESLNGCEAFSDEDQLRSRIALISRGGCLFVEKVRNAQKAGATGVIVADNVDYNSTNVNTMKTPFSMSGDSSTDIGIPSVFMQRKDAETLRELLKGEESVHVLLTWIRDGNEEDSTEQEPADTAGQQEEALSKHSTLKDSGSDASPVCDSGSLFDSGYSDSDLSAPDRT